MNRTFRAMMVLALLGCVALPLSSAMPAVADPHELQSQYVAIIDSVTVINGGSFPTTTSGPTGSFLDFSFSYLPVASVGLPALGAGGVCGTSACDTVLLNVASPGMGCNINRLTEQQKADLVTFVNQGNKLIIYDSECVPQDYSWLPYPFTTVNPGAQGAQGTLNIVEENTLSSADPANVHFIDAGLLGPYTDAVGDMNVMTTYDGNWYLDMSGTNVLGVTGPVHTYAALPPGTLPFGEDAGLLIYNGLDVDYLTSSTAPDASSARGNLAKIWLQELQQEFNPSRLPGGTPVCGLALTPETAEAYVGESHTVLATLTDLLGNPQAGIPVEFSIESGPNVADPDGVCTVNEDCTTDAEGHVSFTYVGDGGVGTDLIWARITDTEGEVICEDSASIEWQAQCVPTDPRWGEQWNMRAIDLVGALTEFPGCLPPPVNVGIIDTGIDLGHPDLAGRIFDTSTLIGADATDINGHGTFMAGIVGANPDDGIGIAGIDPTVRLWIYKFSDEPTDLSAKMRDWHWSVPVRLSRLAEMIRWAVDDGVQVINISSGFPWDQERVNDLITRPCFRFERGSCDGELELAVEYAATQGVIIVTSSGNYGPDEDKEDKVLYPAVYAASFDNVIAVGSSTPDDELSDFSVTGSHVTIAAPGGARLSPCNTGEDDCVLSTIPGGGYAEASGTSAAAPHVAGVVALMLAANPDLSPTEIRQILCDTATPFSVTPSRWGGCGIVNAMGAVRAAAE